MNMTHADEDAQRAAAVALTHLPGATPLRLCALIDAFGVTGAWERVCAGSVDVISAMAAGRARIGSVDLRDWSEAARRLRPDTLLARAHGLGISVLYRGAADYPALLVDDPEPPAVVFTIGDLQALARPLAAVVGTRRASNLGLDIAFKLGADCSRSGIGIVSGLALDIDGAAHGGALSIPDAQPIAVVGCGPDVVYPRQNRHLWDAVCSRGLLLSEYPPGTRPLPERFPARNRLVAGLSRVVVCVESHVKGGSLGTVQCAIDRHRTVLAVPGPAAAAYAEGSNQLLRLHPACLDATDIGIALNWSLAATGTIDPRPEPDGVATAVLSVLGWEPHTVDWLLAQTGLTAGGVTLALRRLEDDRWIAHGGGRWHRLAPPVGSHRTFADSRGCP